MFEIFLLKEIYIFISCLLNAFVTYTTQLYLLYQCLLQRYTEGYGNTIADFPEESPWPSYLSTSNSFSIRQF